MIIFYDKKTGRINGSIKGRVHSKEELNMWVGSKDDNARIVCQWKKGKKGEWEPSVQKDIFLEVLEDRNFLHNFIVDTKTNIIKKK